MEVAFRSRSLRRARTRSASSLVALVVTAVVVAAGAGPAHAATKTVLMGPPLDVERSLRALRSEVDAYFPASVTVRLNDSVRFVARGLHTVDLPARGGAALPFAIPSGDAADAADAAGSRFWFRRFDVLAVQPRLLQTTFGRRLSFAATRRLTSGIPTPTGSKSVTIRFIRAGTFAYFCNINPGMRGIVRVLAPGRPAPTSADDRKAVIRQGRAVVKAARASPTRQIARGVVSVGRSAPGGFERLAFLPVAMTVTTGTIIRFVVPPGSRATHTATTGPGNPRRAHTYLGDLAASFALPILNPVAVYASDPPTVGPVTLTALLHGNGFWNSGVMDGAASSSTPGQNFVRLSASGRYRFYCLIHPSMHTTITVR